MRKRTFVLAAMFSAVTFASGAQAEELRVGFINALTGGGAVVGRSQLNGFMLGLKHEGWEKDGDKLGGVPMKLTIGDDQFRPDVANQVAQRMLRSDDVHVVAGGILSNILLAISTPVFEAKRVLLSTNAGPAPLAGAQCSPYLVGTAFQNDQYGESVGELMNQDKIESVYVLAPNYQAGKDMVAGFERFYDHGKILGRTFYKIGTTDFQAELGRVRAAQPKAVFLFSFGAMGIAFMKQWEASGMSKDIPIYSIAVVDNATLPAIGKAAVGVFDTNWWVDDLDNEANKKFVDDYVKEHGNKPAFFAAGAYDSARLLASAMRDVGKVPEDMLVLAKAMRNTKFASVRGEFKFNVNGMPIQNWYKREVVEGDGGRPEFVTRAKVFDMKPDTYWEKCPESARQK